MSPQVDASPWTPKRIARIARRISFFAAFAGLLYIGLRFEFRSLPVDQCCPLTAFVPGDRIVIDTKPRPLAAGDAVLLRVEESAPLLALVERVRAEDGALWCTTDREGCPGFESSEHGWVPRNVVAGRVLLGWGGER